MVNLLEFEKVVIFPARQSIRGIKTHQERILSFRGCIFQLPVLNEEFGKYLYHYLQFFIIQSFFKIHCGIACQFGKGDYILQDDLD